MARIDKYDPVDGGFRAPLAAAYTGAAAPIGVGLNSSGRVVAGAGATGILGVVCSPSDHAALSPVDIMTDGELLEFAGVAGTTYYAHATTGVISSTPSVYRVGNTVELSRLIVRMRPTTSSGAANVVGDQTAIVSLTNSTGNTPDNTIQLVTPAVASSGEASAADLTTTNAALLALENNASDLAAKVNAVIAALEAAGLLTP